MFEVIASVFVLSLSKDLFHISICSAIVSLSLVTKSNLFCNDLASVLASDNTESLTSVVIGCLQVGQSSVVSKNLAVLILIYPSP